MNTTDATKTLLLMEEKRALLVDHGTRALCGDPTVDTELLDAVTGGRFSEGEAYNEIRSIVLACRHIALPTEKKRRKRNTKAKAKAKDNGSPAKKRQSAKAPPEAPAATTEASQEQLPS